MIWNSVSRLHLICISLVFREDEYFLCISLGLVFILRWVICFLHLNHDVFNVTKKDIRFYMEVQKNRSKYCKRTCALALALHLKRCSVYLLAWHRLWHLKSDFLSEFVWSVWEMCISKSYDLSLPWINFCVDFADCIPDTIYLRNVGPLSQGVPGRSWEGRIKTWPHYW